MNKKQKQYLVVGGIGLILLGTVLYFVTSKPKKVVDNSKEDTTIVSDNTVERDYRYSGFGPDGYFYASTGELIDFFFEDELVGTYICTGEDSCWVPSDGSYYFNTKTKVVLIDDDGYLFYQFIEGKIVSDKYLEVYNMDRELCGNYGDLFVAITENKEAIIINYEGKVVFSGGYEDLGEEIMYSPRYGFSFSKDYIYAKKNGKWGIVKLSDGSIIVDYIYENVFYAFYGDMYISSEYVDWNESRYFLRDTTTGYEYFPGGRSFIVKYDQYYFAVNDNKKLEIYDLNFNQILSESIDVPIAYNHHACCGHARGIFVTDYNADAGTVKVYIDYHHDPNDDYDYRTNIYIFDLNTLEFKKYSE